MTSKQESKSRPRRQGATHSFDAGVGDTKPSKGWKPKLGSNRFTASKKFQSKTLTVRMISPDPTHGIPQTGGWLLHTDKQIGQVKEPTRVTGNFLPASFVVENFGCEVSFTLSVIPIGHGKSEIRITELNVKCANGLHTDLPEGLFRELGLRACTFTAFMIPPNYSFSYGSNHRYHSGSAGDLQIIGSSTIPGEVLGDLFDENASDRERLKRIWNLYQQAPSRQKYDMVAEAHGYPPGSKAGRNWAHKWVKRARKEFAPDTVRKPNKRKGSK